MANNNDPIKFLFKLHRHLTHFTRERPDHPGLTAWSRGVVLLFGLGVALPVLGTALATMPAGLWIIILLGLGIRAALWLYRRSW
jgi:hypothetical protein